MDLLLHNSRMEFHKKLTKLAGERNMNAPEMLAALREAGVAPHENTIRNYFKGESLPRLDVAYAMARILGVSLDYLADDSLDAIPEKKDEIPPDEVAVLSHYRVQRRKEGPAFDPDELAWRIAAPRYDVANPTDAADAAPASAEINARGTPRTGG